MSSIPSLGLVTVVLLAVGQLAQAMPSRPLISGQLIGNNEQPTMNLDNNGAANGDGGDISSQVDYEKLRQLASGAGNNLRLRRQVTSLLDRQLIQQQQQQQLANTQRPSSGVFGSQTQSQLPLLLANQHLFEDEQTIRNQLPELIAQAHQDKTVERALLKMLINASLRSALSNMVSSSTSSSSSLTPQQQQQLLVNLDGANNWLDLDGTISAVDQVAALAHADQGPAARVALATRSNGELQRGLVEQQQQQQLAASNSANGRQLTSYSSQGGLVDKREYIKPCSFNAISCVRTPFRKLLDRET